MLFQFASCFVACDCGTEYLRDVSVRVPVLVKNESVALLRANVVLFKSKAVSCQTKNLKTYCSLVLGIQATYIMNTVDVDSEEVCENSI